MEESLPWEPEDGINGVSTRCGVTHRLRLLLRTHLRLNPFIIIPYRGQPRPKSGSGIMGSGEAALVAYCPNAYLQMQTWPWESSWSQPSLPDTARLPGTPLLHTELPASPATWPPRALKDRTLGSCFKGTILGLSVASTQISQCLLHPETPSFAYWTGLHTC